MMNEKQLDKLIKIARLVDSPVDGEALAAIRMLSKKLKEHESDLSKVIQIGFRVTEFKEPDDSDYWFKDIEEPMDLFVFRQIWYDMSESECTSYLEYCVGSTRRESTQTYLTSFYDFYEDKGYLTEKQLKVIFDIKCQIRVTFEGFAEWLKVVNAEKKTQ